MEWNVITVQRALSDFCLEPEHLEGLTRAWRRSPFDSSRELTVLLRKDVLARAMQVWGTPEKLKRAIATRQRQRAGDKHLVDGRRQPRDMRKRRAGVDDERQQQFGLCGESGMVIVLAIVLNSGNTVLKLVAWRVTGSHSMFSEALHSVSDTVNQIIMAIGIHTSLWRPSRHHPYGYNSMKFVTALIAGVAIFCVGAGLAIQNGIKGLLHPEGLQDLTWAFVVTGVSTTTEVVTLILAIRSLKRSAKQRQTSLSNYILTSQDPGVNVVLTEDFAAVLSLGIAGCCLVISHATESPVADAVGALLVGVLLGCVATFTIVSNVASLLGRSIPEEQLQKINAELEADVMVRAIHDVKGIDMGNHRVRYKAELDFDGRQLTRAYLDVVNIEQMLESVKSIENTDDLEDFMMEHGENIVDMLGGQIDRIERKLKAAFPIIRHCDLEIL